MQPNKLLAREPGRPHNYLRDTRTPKFHVGAPSYLVPSASYVLTMQSKFLDGGTRPGCFQTGIIGGRSDGIRVYKYPAPTFQHP